MSAMMQDLRFAVRQLRRSPGFTVTALLTMMLAVGATAAMVSVLRATLLNQTPYANAGQLVSVGDRNLKGYKANGLVTVARTADLAQAEVEIAGRKTKLFASSAFYYFDEPALVVDGQAPVPVSSVEASGDFLKVLGTPAMLGRWFTPADDARGAAQVVVLSYGLWQRMFAGDARVVGKAVTIGGRAATVVGVMPKHFDYPSETELWLPGHLSAQDFGAYRGSSTRFVNVIARLNDGVSLKDALRGLGLLASRLGQMYAATDAEWGFEATSLRSQILGSYREGLLLLSAAVAMLLLIACANIAGLQLARNAKRRPEIALRRALGITGARLLQQLLTESLLLMVTGSVLGVGLCVGLLRVFAAKLPPEMLSFERPHLDIVTLLVTILVGLIAGVGCGIVPAWQLGRSSEAELVAPGQSRGVVRGARRFDRGFAAAQIALAMVLLALASSLIANLNKLLKVRLGYEPSHVLLASVHLPFGTDPAKVHRLNQQLEKSFAGLPGVDAVGAIDALPLTPFMKQQTADVQGEPPTPHHDAVSAESRTMTPTYLAAMHIPLLAGRGFTDRDGDAKAPSVVIVNQSFVAKYFPQGSAVGQRLLTPDSNYALTATGSSEIVGVIGDVRGTGGVLERAAQPEIYQPERGLWPDMHFVLRTSETAAALEPAMRRQLAAIDAGAALGPVTLFAGSIDRALLQPRLNTSLLSGLAGLALVLVLIGIYGVIAFSVSQRTREIGVRIALGSKRAAILGMLLQESAVIVAGGVALGVCGALLAARVLAAAVSGIDVSIPFALLNAAVLMVLVVFAASFIPARRAALIDPMEALRNE